MSRIRTIKPEFWTSEQIMECSPLARLAFIGMWNFCDDNGVHPASCKTLKAQIFPADDLTAADVQSLIKELLQQRLIVEFHAENRTWWWVTGWRHQLINRPSKSRFPLPPHHAPTTNGQEPNVQQPASATHGGLTEDSVNAHGILMERSLTEGKGIGREEEGKGREEESAQAPDTQTAPPSAPIAEPATTATATAPPPTASIPGEFEAFWREYPQRAGGNPKNQALKSWNARRKEGHSADELLAGTRRYAAFCAATGKVGGEYVKQACTFLGPDKFFTEAWDLPTPATATPRPSQRYAPAPAMTPEVAEFDAILRNLSAQNGQTVIEGECRHVTH